MFLLIDSLDRYFQCLVIMIYNVSYNPAKSMAGVPIKQWKAADLRWLRGKLQNANHRGHSWGSQFPNAFCWLQWFWVRENALGFEEHSGNTTNRTQTFLSHFLFDFNLFFAHKPGHKGAHKLDWNLKCSLPNITFHK